MNEKKSIVVGIRLDEPVRDQLQQIADLEERTISQVIRSLIKKHLKEKEQKND